MLKLIFTRLNKKQYFAVVGMIVLILLQVWLELTIPDYMSEITVLVQTPASSMSEILIVGAKMLACAIGSAIFAVVTNFLSARVSTGFGKRVRHDIFEHVNNFSSAEISQFSTASLITRTTNDTFQIQNFVARGAMAFIKAPVMAIWAIVKISGKNYHWSIATVVAIIFICAVVASVTSYALPRLKKVQLQTDDVNRVTRENLTGLRVVRAYNAESHLEEKFAECNDKLTKTSMKVDTAMELIAPSMSVVMSSLTLAIYWIGAFIINKTAPMEKLIVFSDMVTFSSYAVQIVMSFVMLVTVFIMMPRASVSANRLNEVLYTKSSILSGEGVKVEPEQKGVVEFKNVYFQYSANDADEYVLEDVSFKANKGDVVAFIGATGSGKSTLINLVPRFWDATKGEVLVDGHNVKDFTLKDLRKRIGYASQRAVLFSGSVESNVALGEDEPNVDGIVKAIDISQSADFVANMSGIQAPISQGGKNVSGGQKQRLSIARAIAKKPEILIFDDSFSALDYKTDKTLRAAINKELTDTTVLLVAQRIGTIKDADLILVLDDGKVVGKGKHEELLKKCKVYKEIALSQLSEEELNENKK